MALRNKGSAYTELPKSSSPRHRLGIMDSIRPRVKEWERHWEVFRHDRAAMAGLVMVLFILAIAVAAPLLAPPGAGDPMQIPYDNRSPKPPFVDGSHPLGTGANGADIYYGVVWGARSTVVASLSAILGAAFIGLILGAVSGYAGGTVDEMIMRLTDIFLSVPALVLAMGVASVMTRSLENMMLALILAWWPAYARLVRGQVLVVRENAYVEVARAAGAGRGRVLFRHVIPNSISPLIVTMTLDLGMVALVLASLSYIGFGVPAGYADWGRMVSDGQRWFLGTVIYEGTAYTPWWTVVFPGMMIVMLSLGFSLLGDGLRNALDPRLRR